MVGAKPNHAIGMFMNQIDFGFRKFFMDGVFPPKRLLGISDRKTSEETYKQKKQLQRKLSVGAGEKGVALVHANI